MKFFNTVFGILFAIVLFNIFWPLLVFFGIVILIYVIYIRFKIQSAMKNQENMYQDNQSSYDEEYTNTSYSNTSSNQNSSSDVIDVEYSEREVKDN